MPRIHFYLIGLALLSALVASHAQVNIDRSQAAAMVRTWVFAAEGIAARCSKSYPQVSKQIERDLATWKRQERVAIGRAESIWREMQATSPRSQSEVRADQDSLNQLWVALTTPQAGDPPNFAESRCTQYVQDRANGVLRSRRPEVFQALERQ